MDASPAARPARPRVEPLGRDAAGLATAVLADAFAAYPVMRHVLGDAAGYPARLAALAGFFVTARLVRGEPVLGAFAGGELHGVALVSRPGSPALPAAQARALDEARDALWARLGGGARLRYAAFGRACLPLTVGAAHLHLNMLGVPARHRGQGAARALLDAVHALSREDAESTGVVLTTEDPRNVALYEHFGYRVIGRAPIAPGLVSWGMFRAD